MDTTGLHKLAIVILDGAAGEPLAELGGRTTLQAAQTPHLDYMAANGKLALVQNVPDGLKASSDIACTSIMGYNPALYPVGRGAIEAAALGIDLADNEVALRLNLCNVSDTGKMNSYSTGNISTADGNALIKELKTVLDDDIFTLYSGVGFRGILVAKDHPELLNAQFAAAHNITGKPIVDFLPTGPGSQIIIDYMNRAQKALSTSPTNAARHKRGELVANTVFAFWPGKKPNSMPNFNSVYGKLAPNGAAMISGVDLLKGIAKLIEIDNIEVPGVTDGFDTDYVAQGVATIKALHKNDVVFCHVEAPDAAGHDGNVAEKIAAIENIDQHIIAPLIKNNPARILALPDHPTPIAKKTHSKDPVPAVVWGQGICGSGGASGSSNTTFSEASAAAAELYEPDGYKLLADVLK